MLIGLTIGVGQADGSWKCWKLSIVVSNMLIGLLQFFYEAEVVSEYHAAHLVAVLSAYGVQAEQHAGFATC